jgi:hypothetical protein
MKAEMAVIDYDFRVTYCWNEDIRDNTPPKEIGTYELRRWRHTSARRKTDDNLFEGRLAVGMGPGPEVREPDRKGLSELNYAYISTHCNW